MTFRHKIDWEGIYAAALKKKRPTAIEKDHDLAKRLGVSVSTVSRNRKALGVEPYDGPYGPRVPAGQKKTEAVTIRLTEHATECLTKEAADLTKAEERRVVARTVAARIVEAWVAENYEPPTPPKE